MSVPYRSLTGPLVALAGPMDVGCGAWARRHGARVWVRCGGGEFGWARPDTKRMREYLEVPYLKEVCVKDASRVRVVHVEGYVYVAAANF